jgi:hypothetical protein
MALGWHEPIITSAKLYWHLVPEASGSARRARRGINAGADARPQIAPAAL